ncbi:MAG: hypothetical protein K9J17_12520 [Flavobacteriales bacterium]|nr:hypothetical protein [Flavobacteriales bacterium]
MGHLSKYILSVLFVAMLSVPLINQNFSIWNFEQKDENRDFHEKPTLKLDHMEIFPGQFDAYFEDAFSFKPPLLELYKFVKLRWLRVSPYPEKTMLGNDGWYFLTQKEGNILAGKKDFTPAHLAAFKTEWQRRSTFLDSLGIVYHWYIMPMKHYVYKDKLKYNAPISPRPKRVAQLQEFLNAAFPDLVYDPTEVLIKARDSVEVYQKRDNHWNYQAGYSVSAYIIETLKKDFPQLEHKPFSAYGWKEKWGIGGFHAGVLGFEDSVAIKVPIDSNEDAIQFSYGFPPTPELPFPDQYEFSYRKSDTTGPRILIIRDSFGDYLRPFFKESFSESVFIFDAWNYDLPEKIVLQVKPDIVLFWSLETHIGHVIRNSPEYTDDY